METPPLLQVQQVTKTYRNGTHALTVLDDVSFSIPAGATCCIVGPSGRGKTTLLRLRAGLDRPSSGSVIFDGMHCNDLNEDELAAVRSRSVGFVFQTFQLIPTLTALENVMVPVELQGNTKAHERAAGLLQQVGLQDRLHHYPTQLPAENSNTLRWRGLLLIGREFCSPTNQPAIWMKKRAKPLSPSCLT